MLQSAGGAERMSNRPDPRRILIRKEPKVLGLPADGRKLRLYCGKPPKVSRESNMPTNDRDRHRPEPIAPDSTWNPAPATAKPDRATYQESRRAELDRIRLMDIKRRQLLGYFCPLGIPEIDHLWDDEDISQRDREENDKAAHELHMSHRVLVHAVEGYLLGCVECPDLTGEGALRRATSTDSLIDLLQAEDDLMIRTFGPPWVEHPVPLSRSNGLQPPGAGKVPTRGSSTSGTATPWSWPWR
jgi:hypothetical protein